jgi:hypothetical protein
MQSDPLSPYRASIQQLRLRTEQLLATASNVPSRQSSPLDSVNREIFAGIGAAVTGELFGRRRIGAAIGRSMVAGSQAAQRRQSIQRSRAEAVALVQQGRQVVNSLTAVVGARETRVLLNLLFRAEAAHRPETVLRKVLEVTGRLDSWQPVAVTPIDGEPAADSLRELEKALRGCIEDRLSRLSTNWWIERIPADIRSHVERRKALRERVWPWLGGGDHELVEYLDFPDYTKIILDTRNWSDVFESVFVDQQALAVKLRELQPIRADVEHSRLFTRANRTRLRLYSDEIRHQIGG